MPTTDEAEAELLSLFPPGSRLDADGELVVGGCRLADLAAAWGTPLYVLDDEAVSEQVRRFRHALELSWPNARMVWASKSFPCTAVYRLMAAEGIGVDVAGGGELVMALAGGVDPASIVMHGNAKTTAELAMATEAGVGLIVYYYAIHSRLSPQRVGANVRYAVTDAQQEDAELGLAEHV